MFRSVAAWVRRGVDLRQLGRSTSICLPTNTIDFAMQAMAADGADTVVVIDLDQRVVGVLGRERCAQADPASHVGDVMGSPASIGFRHSAAEALVQMDQWECDRLPVIDANGEVTCVLFREDLAPFFDLEAEHDAQAVAARERVLATEHALHLVNSQRVP